ncbi:ribosome maturation factor RimP [Hymenobacter fastidiosus]|uniref:Ribosome maturation factor RimP n=2 Tax=Hymenobacter fastidiosus TaxID=486264 RepID=A0ABP7SM49_9BACT
MLQDSITDLNVFVIDLTISDSAIRPKVTAILDSEEGLGIDQCAKVSRRLAHRIDEAYGEEASYTIEVTSPGADQPLTDPRQYARHTGRTLKLTLTDGTEKTGTMEAVEAEGVQLAEEVKVKTKKSILPAVLVPFADIKEARVVISFK